MVTLLSRVTCFAETEVYLAGFGLLVDDIPSFFL